MTCACFLSQQPVLRRSKTLSRVKRWRNSSWRPDLRVNWASFCNSMQALQVGTLIYMLLRIFIGLDASGLFEPCNAVGTFDVTVGRCKEALVQMAGTYYNDNDAWHTAKVHSAYEKQKYLNSRRGRGDPDPHPPQLKTATQYYLENNHRRVLLHAITMEIRIKALMWIGLGMATAAALFFPLLRAGVFCVGAFSCLLVAALHAQHIGLLGPSPWHAVTHPMNVSLMALDAIGGILCMLSLRAFGSSHSKQA